MHTKRAKFAYRFLCRRVKVNLHSIRNAHFYTFFTYVNRIRFSVRKRTKTDTQILHVLYVQLHTVSSIAVHFICKYQRMKQNNKIACAVECSIIRYQKDTSRLRLTETSYILQYLMQPYPESHKKMHLDKQSKQTLQIHQKWLLLQNLQALKASALNTSIFITCYLRAVK